MALRARPFRPLAATLLLLANSAAAQQKPTGEAAPSTPEAVPSDAQEASAGDATLETSKATEVSSTQATDPSPPKPRDPFVPVDDPFLTPVPQAERVLRSWQEALHLLRTRNPNLQRAYAQIEIAKGQSRQALAKALPTLVTTGNLRLLFNTGQGASVGQEDPLTHYTQDITLRVPLLAARDWYDRGTAKHAVKITTLQTSDAERLIVGGLAEMLVGVVTAERLSEVTRLNLAAALSTLELNRRRARMGGATAIDVLRAEQEVATSRSQVVQSDETLRQARENLGLSLGYPEAWGVDPTITLDQLRADARSTCTTSEDISERPDVKAARANNTVADRNIKSVNLSFLPTISAAAQASYTTIPQFAFSQNNVTWNITGLLSWNLYDGGFRYGERAAAVGQRDATEQDTLDTERQAELEVTRTLRGVDVATQNLALAQRSQKITLDNSKLARIRFVNGTGSSFDMVQTQNAARQAAIDVTVKEFELLTAQISAFLALASCDI